jgi:hypothetical protein
MRKHPLTLMIRIGNGDQTGIEAIHWVIANLRRVPSPPPIATRTYRLIAKLVFRTFTTPCQICRFGRSHWPNGDSARDPERANSIARRGKYAVLARTQVVAAGAAAGGCWPMTCMTYGSSLSRRAWLDGQDKSDRTYKNYNAYRSETWEVNTVQGMEDT